MKPITEWTGQDVVSYLKTVDREMWMKIGIVAAGIALFLIVFAWPAWMRRPELLQELKDTKSQIVRVESLKRKRPQWIQDKKNYADFIADIAGRLYRSDEISLLLGTISKLAEESGVQIIASRPHRDTPDFPPPFHLQYKAEYINLTVEGGYHALGEFVSRIESNPKMLRIELFEVSPREGNPESHLATITLAAVTYQPGKEVYQALKQAANPKDKKKSRKKAKKK
ncbi:MAG: type 4a pilus biogenesis protein PilO [Candidatus Omnitrophota bacterium]|nr:type 4a pilus biogenesis protein PilO [Candidatus Omnitrophota bacterium]